MSRKPREAEPMPRGTGLFVVGYRVDRELAVFSEWRTRTDAEETARVLRDFGHPVVVYERADLEVVYRLKKA